MGSLMDNETSQKRIIIVGGVAGGASAAARARRLCEKCEIIVFERGPHVSFGTAACRTLLVVRFVQQDLYFSRRPILSAPGSTSTSASAPKSFPLTARRKLSKSANWRPAANMKSLTTR